VLVAKNTTRIEAENPLTVVKDQAINGSIGVSRGTLDSGGSVRVYDKGDAIRVRFSIAASGAYQIGLRVRSGGSTGTTSFWPDGYAAQLDGAPAALAGDPNTLSARDPAFGGAYWGTMISGPLTLAAGEHSLVITAEASWGLVDYVEVTTLVPATGGTTAASPPTGRAWTHGDIGAVGVTGTTRQQRDTFTLTGSGADIWDATVGFQYARQSANGDGAVTARIEALQDSDPWAKAGVMMRASLDPQAAFAAVYATPENGIAFQWRPAEGAPCDSVRGPGVRAPYWARVVRTGGVFTGYISSDGSRWIALGAATIAMESAVSVGLAVTSHAYSTPATAVFGSVGIRFSGDSPGAASAAAVPAAAILPTAGDIGSVSTAGSSVLTGGEYRITGCGADIWNTAVGFQFARQIWTGDTVITARIKTLDDTDAWAKAGVMIRASADANAPFAGIYATPESGVVFQWRPATGIECSSTPASTVPIPCWVRLARVGDTFTAYASADGRTWTVLGTTPIAMAPEVAVGLAVTSHNPSKAASSTMDSVTLVGAEP
jgi:regulation of enolase protein 1 (concanavalin A-like superfamily)